MYPNKPKPLTRIYDYLAENSGTILVMIGIIFLLIGILDFSITTSYLSILGFFLGISLIPFGFLVNLGVITLDYSIKGNLGSLSVAASVFLLAGACTSIIYTAIGKVRFVIPMEEDWPFILYEMRLDLIHPFLWLFIPLSLISMCCLIFGIILKKI